MFAEQVFARELVCVIGGERNDRVGEDSEVGAAADAVDGIGGLRIAGIEMSLGGGSQVASGRKTENADTMGRHGEFFCAGADEAYGSLGVAEFDGMVVAWTKAIFQHECVDAHGVEPIGDLAAFVIVGEVTVAAAGDDDDRRCWCGIGRGWKEGEGWAVGVGVTQCARSGAVPEGNSASCEGGIL